MKKWFLLLVLSSFASILSPASIAEERPDPKIIREFDIKFKEAQDAFIKNDISTAQRYVDEADALIPGQAAILNIRGAIFYKEKKYDEALAIFQKLLIDDPSSYAARFNLSEVLFMQKKYDEALAEINRILAIRPGDEASQIRLVLLLAYLGKMDEARLRAGKMPHPGQTAAYYYARAALEYMAGNTSQGNDWIQQSEILFPPETSLDLRILLLEHGLLKS